MDFTYRGLKAELARHIITDEEINRQIERLRQQSPRITPVNDRPAQLGDEVVLDYKGFCDDEQFPGGTAENQTLVLGSGMFIPGFEEQLVDKVPDEPVTVFVTFPTEYHAAELAGKEARFECVIRQIRLKEEYDLDDTFAKEVGQCDTFEEMREKLGESLQAYTDERGEMDLQDRLLRQAAATLDYTPDEAELEAAVDVEIQNLEAQLAHHELTLEMYCQFMNTGMEELRKDSYPAAKIALRNHAAVLKIAELENLEPTSEEISQSLAMICRQNGITMDQLKEIYDAEFEVAVMKSILTGKVMRLIRDAADITVTVTQ
ncbi:MAG: trigger factor [Lachnospiraceae bacterium]|nr:trigger factor [Lachnospiraceae bacterium]